MLPKILIDHRQPADSHGGSRPHTGLWMRRYLHDAIRAGKNASQNRRCNHRHVMLVQSCAIELKTVAEMVSVLGYRVTPVEKSSKALLYLNREPCDVVISELDMPQINGYQLAQRIRQHSPRTCVLLMTACCQAEVADYMNNPVVDGWLFKPFGINVLKEKLNGQSGS